MYLFDKKRERYFRRDGHHWRKKPNGKTVRETHEKLKVLQPRCRVLSSPWSSHIGDAQFEGITQIYCIHVGICRLEIAAGNELPGSSVYVSPCSDIVNEKLYQHVLHAYASIRCPMCMSVPRSQRLETSSHATSSLQCLGQATLRCPTPLHI